VLAAEPITAAILPGIERLTALEDLSLFCCNLEPCLLPMTTGLTRLYLWRVTLQPSQAQQDSALGASQLLQLLARLTALQELRLADISWPQQLLAPYSALTASSNLRGLHICDCDMQGAVWAHVFPAGRKLPQLRLFSSDKFLCQDPTPFGSADISRLVSCCPAVEELTFTPAADASLALLRSLTELKSLYCGSVSPAVIRSDLAALSQLRRLGLSVSLPAAGAGEDESAGLQHLLHLTALTCLTSSCLGSHAGWLSSKVSHPCQGHCMHAHHGCCWHT
jgi:hypothetical protein